MLTLRDCRNLGGPWQSRGALGKTPPNSLRCPPASLSPIPHCLREIMSPRQFDLSLWSAPLLPLTMKPKILLLWSQVDTAYNVCGLLLWSCFHVIILGLQGQLRVTIAIVEVFHMEEGLAISCRTRLFAWRSHISGDYPSWITPSPSWLHWDSIGHGRDPQNVKFSRSATGPF